MSGVSKIAIAESASSLKSLMKKQKKALSHAKIQALYLLKIQAVETIRYLAVVMGRSESLWSTTRLSDVFDSSITAKIVLDRHCNPSF